MTQLHQIVAIEKTAKAEANAAIDRTYKVVQKPDLFAGIARTYEPIAEDGQQLPAESTKVQYRAEDLLADTLRTAWTRLLDLVATKDNANTEARANVMVDGKIVLADAPVTYLIWLEKQLVEMRTVVSKLPTLDNAFDWRTDLDGTWVTGPTKTVKTAKVPKNHVLYPATAEHPAQVQMYTEDVAVGTWTTFKFSGAMPASRQRELLERIGRLLEAVKFAREEANSLFDVTDMRVGSAIFDFLLAPSSPA